MAGLWAGLASFGCRGPGRPSRAGKRGGLEGPAPRGCCAVFLGSGRQRVSGSLSPQGTSPHGFWGQYLSPGGDNFNRLVTTCMGYSSVSRSRRDSTLCRADCMWMHARFSWMQLMIFGTWRGHR